MSIQRCLCSNITGPVVISGLRRCLISTLTKPDLAVRPEPSRPPFYTGLGVKASTVFGLSDIFFYYYVKTRVTFKKILNYSVLMFLIFFN